MNSPTDHGSPESSSSGSPLPEEASPVAGSSSSYLSNFASHITTIGNFSSGPSKRRLPQGSSFGAASSTRDPKTRRRERGEPGRPGWEKESGGGGNMGKKEPKDDLLDQGLVEHLRKGVLCFLLGIFVF